MKLRTLFRWSLFTIFHRNIQYEAVNYYNGMSVDV